MGSLLGAPAEAASALIRTGVIAPAVTYILGRAHAESDHAALNDASHDLVAQTTELVRTEGWNDPVPLLEDRQPHPTDSHPPTIRRISALGVNLDDDLLNRATRRPEQGVRPFVHGLFPDWTGLCRRLSQDFIDDARKARALRREALEKVVADVADETVVYDNVKPMIWTMGIVAGIFGAFGLSVVVFSAWAGLGYDPFGQMMMAAVTSAFAAAATIYAVFLHRRAARPLMVLNADGLVSPRLDRPIAWTEIAKYAVYASTRFSLCFWLHPDATLPKKDWRALYSKVDRRQRVVTLGAMGIRGMKPADFSGLVGRYLYAAYARQELAAAASGPPQVATADENVDQ